MLPGATGEARYPIAALPSGTCPNEGETCEMAAGNVTTCPEVGSKICDLTQFQCRCANGTWECFTAAQGGGICPCDVDASAHADASAE
jgi:hypothetical protein